MIKKLTAMPYAQAYVVTNDIETVLISYTTPVVEIDNEGWLKVNGLYSATTRKHISAFMKEYTILDYYTAKLCYECGDKINIYTGEVVSL